jgi:hypothetical protein
MPCFCILIFFVLFCFQFGIDIFYFRLLFFVPLQQSIQSFLLKLDSSFSGHSQLMVYIFPNSVKYFAKLKVMH